MNPKLKPQHKTNGGTAKGTNEQQPVMITLREYAQCYAFIDALPKTTIQKSVGKDQLVVRGFDSQQMKKLIANKRILKEEATRLQEMETAMVEAKNKIATSALRNLKSKMTPAEEKKANEALEEMRKLQASFDAEANIKVPLPELDKIDAGEIEGWEFSNNPFTNVFWEYMVNFE